MEALLYQLCFTNRTLCLLVSENQIASLVDATLANEVSLFTNLSTRNIFVLAACGTQSLSHGLVSLVWPQSDNYEAVFSSQTITRD